VEQTVPWRAVKLTDNGKVTSYYAGLASAIEYVEVLTATRR